MFSGAFWLPAYTLWLREIVRFYRQPSRIVGALGSPLVFWLLIGSGIGASFKGANGTGYLEYFFPGTLLLILLFSSIFSTFSLIEDRREGFMQSVLVSPIARSSIVMGKILGGSTFAVMQGLLFIIIVQFFGIRLTWGLWLQVTLILFVNAFAMTALGFFIAWRMHSIQGFHAIMNLFLIPLWLLSGALFPAEGASGWMQWVMKCNPLTYGLTSLRLSLEGNGTGPVFFQSTLVLMIAALVLFGLCAVTAGRRSAHDLP